MRIKIIALVYGKTNSPLLNENITRAGYENFYLQKINESPLSRAMNLGLVAARDCDAVMFLANDIREPNDWLWKRVDLMRSREDVGIVSIYPSPGEVPHGTDLIGNYLINMRLVREIGCFTQEFGVYGAIDLDYCHRARVAGFSTLYVHGVNAEHYTYNHDTVYGFSKAAQIKKTWSQHAMDVGKYLSGEKPAQIDYPEYNLLAKSNHGI